jgi:cell division septation protein DedD
MELKLEAVQKEHYDKAHEYKTQIDALEMLKHQQQSSHPQSTTAAPGTLASATPVSATPVSATPVSATKVPAPVSVTPATKKPQAVKKDAPQHAEFVRAAAVGRIDEVKESLGWCYDYVMKLTRM